MLKLTLDSRCEKLIKCYLFIHLLKSSRVDYHQVLMREYLQDETCFIFYVKSLLVSFCFLCQSLRTLTRIVGLRSPLLICRFMLCYSFKTKLVASKDNSGCLRKPTFEFV